MAHVVTIRTLLESESKITLHVLIESDGSAGELVNYVILDPVSSFSNYLIDPRTTNQSGPPFTATIMQVWHSQAWFDVLLRFNALVPVTGWAVARDSDAHNDFRYFGGIKDPTTTESDGKVMISTNGIDGVFGAVGTLIIEFKKS